MVTCTTCQVATATHAIKGTDQFLCDGCVLVYTRSINSSQGTFSGWSIIVLILVIVIVVAAYFAYRQWGHRLPFMKGAATAPAVSKPVAQQSRRGLPDIAQIRSKHRR